MVSSFEWGVCPGHRFFFSVFQAADILFVFFYENKAGLSGILINRCRWHLKALEVHGMTAMGKVFIPGDIIMAALAAGDHLATL